MTSLPVLEELINPSLIAFMAEIMQGLEDAIHPRSRVNLLFQACIQHTPLSLSSHLSFGTHRFRENKTVRAQLPQQIPFGSKELVSSRKALNPHLRRSNACSQVEATGWKWPAESFTEQDKRWQGSAIDAPQRSTE